MGALLTFIYINPSSSRYVPFCRAKRYKTRDEMASFTLQYTAYWKPPDNQANTSRAEMPSLFV